MQVKMAREEKLETQKQLAEIKKKCTAVEEELKAKEEV